MIASFTISSELMEQEIPQTALPSTERFYVAYDDNLQPMIFSRGTNGLLYLITVDPTDGKNRLVDLSQKFKLEGKVTALNITQDQDLKVYLVFAEERGPTKWSKIHVVKPFNPKEQNNRYWIDNEDLTGMIIKGEEKETIFVSQIHLVSLKIFHLFKRYLT
jgi:hypothetical protein